MQSQFVTAVEEINLTNCDREPIHAPGTVQSHGALLALDPTTERVLAASENSADLTGVELDQTINALAADIFGSAVCAQLRAVAKAQHGTGAASLRLPGFVKRAIVHRTHDTLYVEIEPAASADTDFISATRDAMREFLTVDDVKALCDIAAVTLREISGYDRVMVYRFDADGHGQVVAEARNERLEAYLGLHYPAGDIPRQARNLYRTTMVRLIVDVDGTPAALEPALDPRNGEPWDLGRAILRSSSAIHLQYLRNMGVTGTMTVSLLRNGELWGLIACHHYSRRFVGSDVRGAAETLGLALVARIVQLEDTRVSALRLAAMDAVFGFVSRAQVPTLVTLAQDVVLQRDLGVSGMCLLGDSVVQSGRVPSSQRLRALMQWLQGRSGSDTFVTSALAKLNPTFTDIADVASGVYATRIRNDWIVAFRGERPEIIEWGGDPTKAADSDPERLSPRGSAALYRQEVRHHAEPWDTWTLEALDRAIAWACKAAT